MRHIDWSQRQGRLNEHGEVEEEQEYFWQDEAIDALGNEQMAETAQGNAEVDAMTDEYRVISYYGARDIFGNLREFVSPKVFNHLQDAKDWANERYRKTTQGWPTVCTAVYKGNRQFVYTRGS